MNLEPRSPFTSTGDELNYLADQIRGHTLPSGEFDPNASPFVERFATLLNASGSDDGSIMLQDHWALLCEVRHDFRRAVQHREAELLYLDELFGIDGPVGPIDRDFFDTVAKHLVDDCLALGDSAKVDQLLHILNEDLHVSAVVQIIKSSRTTSDKS